MAESIILADRIEVRYGATRAVRGLDLAVSRGEVIGLIGPDGAGKTSTLRVIAGLLSPTSGHVTVLGRDSWRHRRALHHRLGYLAQRFALYGDLTVNENVQFFSLLLGVREWRARRTVLLERVGLAPFADRAADRLSGGMRQKLALACSLMHSPEILILDEPTTGVDPVTRREFWRLLADLVADGLTLLVATPYLDEAERCSRVVLMHRGGLLADATPTELRGLLPGVVFEVVAEPRLTVASVLAGIAGVIDVRPFGASFHVRAESGGDFATTLRSALDGAGARVDSVRAVATSLEDTFLHLVETRSARDKEEAA